MLKPPEPPLAGSLAEHPLAELLVHLDARGFTGGMEIAAGGRTHVVAFSKGRPCKARLGAQVELIGKVLIDTGAVPSDRIGQALALQESVQGLLGAVLLDMNWVSAEALEEALREQVRRRLVRLFLLGEGTYRLEEGIDPLAGVAGDGAPVDALQVIPVGLRGARATADVEARFALIAAGRTVTATHAPGLDRLALSDAERGACRFLARGAWDAGVFASVPPDRREPLVVAAYCLLVVGGIVEAGEDVADAEARSPSGPPPERPGGEAPGAEQPHGAAEPPRPTAPPLPVAPPMPTIPPRPVPSAAAPPLGAVDAAAARALREEVSAFAALLGKRNHFEVLGLPGSAGAEEVRDRYLDLVKRYHPDRASRFGLDDLRGAMEEILMRLQEAAETLTDPAARERYAATLRTGRDEDAEARSVVDAAVAAENAYQMAIVCERRKRLDDAQRHADEAVRLCPDQGEYICMRDWIAACRRPKGTSVEDLLPEMLGAASRAPKNERAQMQTARLLQRAGRQHEAAEFFRRVVGINPHNIEAARELRIQEMRQPKGQDAGGGILSRFLRREKK